MQLKPFLFDCVRENVSQCDEDLNIGFKLAFVPTDLQRQIFLPINKYNMYDSFNHNEGKNIRVS